MFPWALQVLLVMYSWVDKLLGQKLLGSSYVPATPQCLTFFYVCVCVCVCVCCCC